MRRLTFLCCLLALFRLASAVPAPSHWLAGESSAGAFRFHLVGDEFCHWAVSEDGYTLLQDGAGIWRYARPTPEGALAAGPREYRPGSDGPLEARGLVPERAWLRSHVQAQRGRLAQRPRIQLGQRVEGVWNLLVLLIRYPDQQAQVDSAAFEGMMDQPGWHGGTGSFADFYSSLSYGRFQTQADVVDWTVAANNHDHYGYNQGWEPAQQLVREAVLAADPFVDFSRYDNNQDGVVDALLVVHTGQGAEEGDESNIWSHRWALWGQELHLDGVTVSDYTIQPELQGGAQSAIGVYVHEFGHALGLPDLYDTDYSSSGVGNWCVMSGGSWGGGGPGGNAHVPASFSAWCRKSLGWATVVSPEVELLDHPLPAIHLSDEVVRMDIPGQLGQYFLMENRRLAAWDRHQAAEGLFIWHVDESVDGNSDENHPQVDLEQADGQRDLNQGIGSDSGDLFPGSTGNRHFDAWTTPSSRAYSGGANSLIITAIGDPADSQRVSFFQSFNHQELVCDGVEISDDSDGDQVAEAGEELQLRLRLTNRGSAVDSLLLSLSCAVEGIVLPGGPVHQGPVGAGESFLSPPFELVLGAGLATGRHPLELASRDGAGWTSACALDLQVGRGDLLLVLDGAEESLAAWYESALAGWPGTVERRLGGGRPPLDLAEYRRVAWVCAQTPAPLDTAEVRVLRDYVEEGGHLLLSGQHLLEGLEEEGLALLGADPGAAWASMPRVKGLAAGGLFLDDESMLLAGAQGAWNQQLPTTSLLPRADAVACGRWSNSPNVAMVRRQAGAGRVVTAGYSLESIHTGANLLSLAGALERILLWLDEGIETGVEPAPPVGRPAGIRLAAAPNPFNPSTRLSVELARPATLHLRVFDLAGHLVEERPLGRRGAGGHTILLEMAGKPSGLYLAEIAGDGGLRACARLMLLK